MPARPNTGQRARAILLLRLVVCAIGCRYVLTSTGVRYVAGWLLVVGSLLALIGHGLAHLRGR
jgi:hypothetical protein